MAQKKRLPKKSPNRSQIIAKNRRVPRIDTDGQWQPTQPVFIKKVRVLGAKLYGVPKERIVTRSECQGNDAETIKAKYKIVVANGFDFKRQRSQSKLNISATGLPPVSKIQPVWSILEIRQ